MAADSDLGAEALPNKVVVTEILARLPAKSMGRFRCVSRGWSAMLSPDYFIDLHRQRANRPDHLRLLLTANGSSYDGYLYSWQPGGDGAVEKLMRDDFGLQYVVTKPCRGLVLIRATDCGGYYVVNPCSGEALALPDSQVPFKMAYKTSGWSRRSVEPPCYLRVSYGLGYCTTRKEYKVVLVRLFSDPEPGDGGGGFTPTTCEVFVVLGTTGTGYWRPSAERSPLCSVTPWNYPAVFLDGYLHFLCFDGGIVTFSIGDETFGSLLSPPGFGNVATSVSVLTELDGSRTVTILWFYAFITTRKPGGRSFAVLIGQRGRNGIRAHASQVTLDCPSRCILLGCWYYSEDHVWDSLLQGVCSGLQWRRRPRDSTHARGYHHWQPRG